VIEAIEAPAGALALRAVGTVRHQDHGEVLGPDVD
jgi:hypothetical protein